MFLQCDFVRSILNLINGKLMLPYPLGVSVIKIRAGVKNNMQEVRAAELTGRAAF
jgi:hypothetical protein